MSTQAQDEAIRAANQLVIRQSHKIHAEHAAHCDEECFKNAGHAAVMTIVELMRERDALRAIIEGRTTPPTEAERRAHHDAHGGRWMQRDDDDPAPAQLRPIWQRIVNLADFDSSYYVEEFIAKHPGRWWPLDSTGRPCAWPVATEAPRG